MEIPFIWTFFTLSIDLCAMSRSIRIGDFWGYFLFIIALGRKFAFCDISDCISSSLPKIHFMLSVSSLGGVAYSIILGSWWQLLLFDISTFSSGFQRIEIWLVLLQIIKLSYLKVWSKLIHQGGKCRYILIIDDHQLIKNSIKHLLRQHP